MNPRLLTLVTLGLCLAAAAGCTGRVARTITVESQPQGAIVWLNDNEVGRTPVSVPFTWYGVYRIRLEKEGYETLTVYQRVAAPWYQWVGIDLAFETVIPGTRHDDHHLGPYVLKMAKPADTDRLIERAEVFREEAAQAVELR